MLAVVKAGDIERRVLESSHERGDVLNVVVVREERSSLNRP